MSNRAASQNVAGGTPVLAVRELRLGVDAAGGRDSFEPVLGATFHANRREVVGVVGESGCGKSLTLRSIAGLLPTGVRIRGGEITVDGIDVVRASREQLRRLRGNTVGMIFQDPTSALNPTMKIGTQIAEAARAHGKMPRSRAKERAIELLDRTGFADPERRSRLYPHQLSGGMRQRVMIAIALAGEPSLLLCDEPTTALDSTVSMRILDVLVGLVSEFGLGVVLVTHDLGVAARVCDRIVVMYGGRVVEEGPAGDVLRRPRHPYTLALLRAVPTRDGRIEDLRAIPGTLPTPGQDMRGCPFAPRCEFAAPGCLDSSPELVSIGENRMSACRRQTLLRDLVGSRDG